MQRKQIPRGKALERLIFYNIRNLAVSCAEIFTERFLTITNYLPEKDLEGQPWQQLKVMESIHPQGRVTISCVLYILLAFTF